LNPKFKKDQLLLLSMPQIGQVTRKEFLQVIAVEELTTLLSLSDMTLSLKPINSETHGEHHGVKMVSWIFLPLMA